MGLHILPLTINNRRSTLLALNHSDPETFIIELGQEVHTPLIYIDKSKLIQTFFIGSKDIPLNKCTFNVYTAESKIHIDIIASGNVTKTTEESAIKWRNDSSEKKPESPSKDISFLDIPGLRLIKQDERSKLYLSLYYEGGEIEKDYFDCAFHLMIGEQKFSQEVRFALTEPCSLIHAGFDFGSEASQLRMSRQRTIAGVSRTELDDINLFQDLKDYFGERKEPQHYYQYEKGTPFLKSSFFIKNEIHGNDLRLDEQLFLPETEDIRTLLTFEEGNRIFFEAHKRLINLKIAHKYDRFLSDLNVYAINPNPPKSKQYSLSSIKTAIYGSVLKQILTACMASQLHRDGKYYLKFTLLVPNIYEGFDLVLIKKTIQEIINDVNNTILNQSIKHTEIITLSESDASFMGKFNITENFTKPDHYYIIIDCGKGTTDFSIVQMESDGVHYRNIYRNGFAGAGNLVTYSFYESFCAFLINISEQPAQAKIKLKEILLQLQGVEREQFYSQLENFKLKYQPNATEPEISTRLTQVRSGEVSYANVLFTSNPLANLIDLMERTDTIYDYGDYIFKTINTITDQILNGLSGVTKSLNKNKIPCGGVLISGRGFLFAPLQDLLENKLKKLDIKPDQIIKPSQALDYKTVCLKGVFRTGFIYNPDVVSMPVQMSLGEQPKQKEESNIPWYKKVLNTVHNFLSDDNFSTENNTMKITETDFSKLRFIIGNNFYQPKGVRDTNTAQTQLVYRGDKFILRSMDKNGVLCQTCELEPIAEANQSVSREIFGSLFPHFIHESDFSYFDNSVSITTAQQFDDLMPDFI